MFTSFNTSEAEVASVTERLSSIWDAKTRSESENAFAQWADARPLWLKKTFGTVLAAAKYIKIQVEKETISKTARNDWSVRSKYMAFPCHRRGGDGWRRLGEDSSRTRISHNLALVAGGVQTMERDRMLRLGVAAT
jgi:hypothetical protein